MVTQSIEARDFQIFELGRGMRLLVAPTQKFRRTRVMAVIHDQLDSARVAAGSLLPYVQRRGTQNHPTGLDLERAAGDLYEADVYGGVYKVGDRQLIAYTLDIAADKYIGEPILSKGLELLAETIYHPLVKGDGLDPEYVEQERRFQIGRVKALVNNKIAYARHRCIEEMYKGEPFALHELGTEELISQVDERSLLEHHRDLVRSRPMDVYVVGPVDPERVKEAVLHTMVQERGEVPRLPVTRVTMGSGEPRTVEQTEQMNQGWLVLGLKTDIRRSDADRYGMMFLNGILGGFVHSKLFMNVREKASLAYTASSSYNANKGLVLATAGIDVNKYQQALDIMRKQIDDTLSGDFTDEELEATRRGFRTQYRMRMDTGEGQIMFNAAAVAEESSETIESALEAIDNVSREDIRRAGERLRLDMIYFLKGSG